MGVRFSRLKESMFVPQKYVGTTDQLYKYMRDLPSDPFWLAGHSEIITIGDQNTYVNFLIRNLTNKEAEIFDLRGVNLSSDNNTTAVKVIRNSASVILGNGTTTPVAQLNLDDPYFIPGILREIRLPKSNKTAEGLWLVGFFELIHLSGDHGNN